MRVNRSVQHPVTHEGAKACIITPEQLLKRLTMTCMLWEDEFYVDGKTIASQISEAAEKCNALRVMYTAMDCKHKAFLRHVSLYLLTILVNRTKDSSIKNNPELIRGAIENIITRPDDMCELLSLYWKEGKKPLSAQLKKGLANCFYKFDEYQLAKWDKDHKVKLRDVMFMTHPKPRNEDEQGLFKRIATRTLKTPQTYETVKSQKENKKENLQKLLEENKMGYTALLMNLKNMREDGISEELLEKAILNPPKRCRVLPYQFLKCYQNNIHFGQPLAYAMKKVCSAEKRIPGKTVLLVDVSGSMMGDRQEKANSLALTFALKCDKLRIFPFSNAITEVPVVESFALDGIIRNAMPAGGTLMGAAIHYVSELDADRIIVITDEQTSDKVTGNPKFPHKYMINVDSYRNGVGYRNWTHIDGFSPYVSDFIYDLEQEFSEEKVA